MTRRSSQRFVGAVLRLVSALVALALVVTVATMAAHDGKGPAAVVAAEVVDEGEGEPAIAMPAPTATAVPRARTAPGWARLLELTPLAAAPPPVPPPQA
jgi:hypothetical protein